MVQATRWRADARLQVTNPYQRVRFAATFPSGGQGDSAFGWSPIPIDEPGGIRPVGSPNGFSTASGLSAPSVRWGRRAGRWHVMSGAGLGLSLDVGGLLRGLFAVGGIAAGLWLAKKNLEG